MMDRNREARRAAAMTNGLPRRRHRTTTGGSSLRESPEDDGPLELQETAARLRDRTAKKERDREIRDRDRDRDRERERDRLRSKRRRGDKYMHREDGAVGGGGGGVDDSSEESVNDEEDEDDDGPVRYVPPSNPVPVSSTSAASTLTSHRKSYPPPSKVFRVAPTWKAPDEMIGVSIPRKARSASTKRGHDCWSTSGGVASGGEQIIRQPSSSPVRSTMTATPSPAQVTVPSPSPAPPMSPSSSNISIKKKIKAANGPLKQQRPPKSVSKSSPSTQDEIEKEVAEVLYGLMRQSHAPSNESSKLDSRSINDSKSRVSSPVSNSPSIHHHQNTNHNHNHYHNHSNPTTSSSTPPLTTVAPKRKRPRPYPEETPSGLGPRSSPIPSAPKAESDQAPKLEKASEKNLGSGVENNDGDSTNFRNITPEAAPPPPSSVGEGKKVVVEESGIRNGIVRAAKVEEASSSSPKLESPHNHDPHRVESSTTASTKPNSSFVEQDNHREDKYEIDLMAPPLTSPEREEETAEYGGGDEKLMVREREAEAKLSTKPKEEEIQKGAKCNNSAVEAEDGRDKAVESSKQSSPSLSQPQLNLNDSKERKFDVQLDLEKCGGNNNNNSNVNEEKLNFQKQHQPPPLKPTRERDDAITDKPGQSGTAPLAMSVPGGWHGGLPPMGYVGPLQGVVSMDGTPMASPPIQSPHFLFSQPKPKRCATHCYIARSISVHQQVMKMNPFWPAAAAAAAAGTAPLFGAKPYNLNMVPSAELHAAGRGMVVNSSHDNKGHPFAFFPGQPASSTKDKSPQPPNVPDSSQKKQILLQSALPSGAGAPNNMLHGPALFFPMGQQQAAAANARPSSTKSTSTGGNAASTSAATSAPMGVAPPNSNAGPAMSFSYPNMGGNETQFMAILGNSHYPFPIPAHVGATPPYRGSHPQPMSFFNGSFYSSQMLHPSQLQQQQAAQPSQSMQIQQQNQPNASLSTASSSSQKHLQNQQQRPQGSSAPAAGNPNQGLQNFQATKGRVSQPHPDMGGEDSPSTADSRNRPNMGVYGQNFAMPFHSPNFAMMTPPSSLGSNAAGVPNGNVGDKKQQQPQQTPAFPMSFANMNGAATPGLDISSIAHNHALIQSLPEAARQNYQYMAAAAAAQAAQQKKNNYRGPEDGKSGSNVAADPSSVDEERKVMAARASAASAAGQSIAFSRDFAENTMSTMPLNNVVDTSARSLNMIHGSSTRSTRSPGPHSASNSNSSNPQQQQQQQQQMLFAKQQQYVVPSAGSGRSKTPTSNGNVYSDHHNASSVMAAKFPNSLSGFPPLGQTSGAPAQSPQWKNSVRPNTSQGPSPSVATSTASNMKNLPQQQQGRSQQNQTQISFGTIAANSKASSTSQGQQNQHNNQAPSSPMMAGSPSNSSVSRGASGSPRTVASASTGNKAVAQGSALSSQQGKNSQSPSLTSQKPSILGSPNVMSTTSGKPQMQQSQQQPQLSKQNMQQAQLFFSNAYMQASANTSAAMGGSGYYIQRHRPDGQQHQQQQQQLQQQQQQIQQLHQQQQHHQQHQHQQQQQQQSSKSQGSGPPTSSSTSDPAKAVAAATFSNKPSPGSILWAAQLGAQSAAQSSSGPMCIPVSLANTSTSDPEKAVAAAPYANKGLPLPGSILWAAQLNAQSAAQSSGGPMCTPVSLANTSTSDPEKAVAAATYANKGLPSPGSILWAAQLGAQSAAQSSGGAHQLMSAGYPYVHAVSTAVQVKPADQKQPAGE